MIMSTNKTRSTVLTQTGIMCRIARRIKGFWGNLAGGALIEASLVIPFGVFLFLGVSEFAQGFTVNRRIEAAAGTAADLVTRQPTVSTADLNGIKAMLDEIVRPYPVDTLRLRLTSIAVDSSGQGTVAWSFAVGPGISSHAVGAGITVPAGLAQPDSSVVFAETEYTFQSTLSTLLPSGIEMRGESYFPPRFGEFVERAD